MSLPARYRLRGVGPAAWATGILVAVMSRAAAIVALLFATVFTSVLLAPTASAHATLTSSDQADGARLVSPPVAFVVGDGPLVVPEDAGQASDPVVSVLFSMVRWLAYLGLVLLVGPLVIAALSWSAAAEVFAIGRLFRVGVWLSIGVALVSVVVEALYVSGAPFSRLTSIDVPAILGTTYGTAQSVRAALVAVLAMFGRWIWLTRPQDVAVSPRRAASGPFLVGTSLLIAIALTFAYSGHAIVSALPALAVVSDTTHLLAMSVWLGGLVVLVVALLPRRDDELDDDAELLADVLPRFSRLALIAIAALRVSGTVQAFLEISPLAALWSTTYGLIVTLKAIGLSVIIYLGNMTRRWVLARYPVPAVDPDEDETDVPAAGLSLGAQRRSLLLEVAVAATVLVLAAILVATVPARSAYAAPFAASLALPEGGSMDVVP